MELHRSVCNAQSRSNLLIRQVLEHTAQDLLFAAAELNGGWHCLRAAQKLIGARPDGLDQSLIRRSQCGVIVGTLLTYHTVHGQQAGCVID